MSSSEVARRTQLSAQTASVITRSLEADGLIQRGDPVRGKVGKPSTPMSLAPDGALGFGLRVGRRGADLMLVNFAGQVLGHLTREYRYPTPQAILDFCDGGIDTLTGRLMPAQRGRIAGLGIGMPMEVWSWLELVGAPQSDMEAWKSLDLAAEIERQSGLPVHIGNDVTLSCYGEQMFGTAAEKGNYGYFYVGSFVGGGVVINGRVESGPTGNAGAFGSIVIGEPGARDNQLLHTASLVVLEKMLQDKGLPAPSPRTPVAEWRADDAILTDWLERTARALTTAAISVTAVLDTPAIVIDGGFPPAIRDRLVDLMRAEMVLADTRGIQPPKILAGTLGPIGGALGSAYLPIAESYLLDGYAAPT